MASEDPAVHALVYFDAVTNNQDYTLNSQSLAAFRQMGANPYFKAMPQFSLPPPQCPAPKDWTAHSPAVAVQGMQNGACSGYWIVTSTGQVNTFGSAGFYGDLRYVN